MNTKDLSRIALVKRMKPGNTVGKQIATLAVIRSNLLIGKSRVIARKIKGTIHSLKNPNHINKISYMFP